MQRRKELYRLQVFGEYKQTDIASTIKQRDYKDATDLVLLYGGGV